MISAFLSPVQSSFIYVYFPHFTYSIKYMILHISEKPKIYTRMGKYTYCPKLHKITNLTSHHTVKLHKCINLPKPLFITFEISNIINLIKCVKCGKHYICETGKPFANRICEHIASVNNSRVWRHQYLNTFTQINTPMHMRFSLIQWLGTKVKKNWPCLNRTL